MKPEKYSSFPWKRESHPISLKTRLKNRVLDALLFSFFSILFIAGAVYAAIAWPATPTGEVEGGKFTNIFNGILKSGNYKLPGDYSVKKAVDAINADYATSATTATKLAAGGSVGQVLTSNGTNPPTWATPVLGSSSLAGSTGNRPVCANTAGNLGICSGPVISISASPNIIAIGTSITNSNSVPGQSSTLTWSVDSAVSCSASDGWTGTKDTSGSATVTPEWSNNFTLTCTNSAGLSASATTIVYVKSWSAVSGQGSLGESCDAYLARTGQSGVNGSKPAIVTSGGCCGNLQPSSCMYYGPFCTWWDSESGNYTYNCYAIEPSDTVNANGYPYVYGIWDGNTYTAR